MNKNTLGKTMLDKVISRTLKRTLNEANNGFFKYKNPKPTNNGTNTNNGAPRLARINIKGSMPIDPKDAMKNYPEFGKDAELVKIFISNVWKDTKTGTNDGPTVLINAMNSVFNTLQPRYIKAVPGNALYKVFIIVNSKYKNEIPNMTAKLADAIKQLQEYNEKYVDFLCGGLFDSVDTIATAEDLKNAEDIRITNWQDILNNINADTTRKHLLAYMMTNDYANSYGNVLSAHNVMNILAQFPSASFVVEKRTWMRKFGRRVNPGATKIIVNKAFNNPTNIEMDAAAKALGYGSYSNAMKVTKNSSQIRNLIRITAQGPSGFAFVIMYDVSQTTPIDPNNDKWTKEFGLSNNITGELNDATIELDKQLKLGNDKNKEGLEKNLEIIRKKNETKWQNIRNVIKERCKSIGVDVSNIESMENERFISNATYLFAMAFMRKNSFGLVKESDFNIVAKYTATAVCFMCDCPIPRKLIQFLDAKQGRKEEQRTTKEMAQLSIIIAKELVPYIAKSIRVDKQELFRPDLDNANNQQTTKTATNEVVKGIYRMLVEEFNGDGESITKEEFFKMCEEELGGYFI